MKVNLKVLGVTPVESHPVKDTMEWTMNVDVSCSPNGRILGGSTKVLKNKHGVFFDSDFQNSVSGLEKLIRKTEILPTIQKEALSIIENYDLK